MIKSTTNTQELRLPRPEQVHQIANPHIAAHGGGAIVRSNAVPVVNAATGVMDTLKTTFMPNLNMDPNVINTHYCPMCHQQFERAQHAADHMQLCHNIAISTQQQQQQQQQVQQTSNNVAATGNPPQLKLQYSCAHCDEKFESAHEVEEHQRLSHQATAFLARCLACGIYGVNTATMQNPNEYKCMQCGAVCTAAMLAAGQQTFMEQNETPVTPEEMPAIAPRDMRLTPEEQQQQQQQQHQQNHHQQQMEHHHQQQQQQQQQQQDDIQITDAQVSLKVPPLTVKLNKASNNGNVAHPQVIIKEEPISLSDSGDVNSVPVYAIQQTPVVVQAPIANTTSVVVSTAAATADMVHKIRHKCPDCPKTFKTPGTLSMHRKIHTGEADVTPKERPYTCSYCGKSFTQSNTLKQHTRIHTGEKPFHCGYCDKSFSVKDYLTKHIRTHTGEKPYTCPYCDKRFTQRSALTVHTTKLHPL